MNKLRGFSLMEMMIVLLIVAILAAASAPMISKKLVRSTDGSCPWVWTSLTNNSIAYNIDNSDSATAAVGMAGAPKGLRTRFFIDSVNVPQLSLSANGRNMMHFYSNHKSLFITDNATPNQSAARTVAIGSGTTVSNNSGAIGTDISANSVDSIAIGYKSTPNADGVISIGKNATSNDTYSIALGQDSESIGENSVAIGRKATTDGNNSIAMGANSTTSNNSIVVGSDSTASSSSDIVIGPSINVGQSNTVAIGHELTASGEGAVVIGSQSKSSGNYTHHTTIIGYKAEGANQAVGIGCLAKASANQAVAIGYQSSANNLYTTAVGFNARAHSDRTIAIGAETLATGSGSIAIGYNARAPFQNSVAIGPYVQATSSNQIVLGNTSTTVVIPGTVQIQSLKINKDLEVVGTTRLGTGDNDTYVNMAQFNGNRRQNLRLRHSDGTGRQNVRVSVSSDRRLKNVGKTFTGGLEQLKKLEVFNYTYKRDESKTPHVGVIAQDLQKVFPQAVFKGDDGFLRIRMEDMFFAMLNAIKELDTKTNAILDREKKIDELQNQVNALEKRLSALEKKVK